MKIKFLISALFILFFTFFFSKNSFAQDVCDPFSYAYDACACEPNCTNCVECYYCGDCETCGPCSSPSCSGYDDCLCAGYCTGYCGDGGCNNSETCNSCSEDCGDCPYCGDGSCNNGEDCSSCSDDCGTCTGGDGYCGDGSCNNSETCSSCSGDCGACGATPTTVPPESCDWCGSGTCANGIPYDSYCCCTGTGCNTCGGSGSMCSTVPLCKEATVGCTADSQCPDPTSTKTCGSGCMEYEQCGCAGDCTKVCNSGVCEYRSNACDNPGVTGTATPTTPPGDTGALYGRIWNDINCNGLADEISNSSSDPEMVQNPSGSCGSYTNLVASISYKGPIGGTRRPSQCNPGPYFTFSGPVGNYKINVNPPSGWVATTDQTLITLEKGIDKNFWFGICKPLQGVITGRIQNQANNYDYLKSSAVCTAGTVVSGLAVGFGSGITDASVDKCNLDPISGQTLPYYTKTLNVGRNYTVSPVIPAGWEPVNYFCQSKDTNGNDGGTSCPGGLSYTDGWGGVVSNVPLQTNEQAHIWFNIRPIAPSCTISGSSMVTVGESGLWSATTTVGNLSGFYAIANTAIHRSTSLSRTGIWPSLQVDENGVTLPFYGGIRNAEDSCGVAGTNTCNIKRKWLTAETDLGIHYISCRGWNSDKRECNPFGPYTPYPADVDCDRTVDDVPADAPIIDNCTASGMSDCMKVEVKEPSGWFQVRGGDVHANTGDVKSYVPTILTAANRYFNLDLPSATNLPGLISYVNDFDFNSDAGDLVDPRGVSRSSTKKWLANSSFSPQKTSYNDFVDKLKSQTLTIQADCSSLPVNMSNGKTTIYHITGDCNLARKFSVDSNSKVIFLVDGALSVEGSGTEIKVAIGSFLSFIVHGDIAIAHNIGNKMEGYAELPMIEGIYITNGNIYTGSSLGAKNIPQSGLRLIAAGSFFAGNFDLGRDLKDNGLGHANNINTPAELFTFRPDLVINAPYELWSSKIDWQEVVP
jgi:hypothetical protein